MTPSDYLHYTVDAIEKYHKQFKERGTLLTQHNINQLSKNYAKDRHKEEYDDPAFMPDVVASIQCFRDGLKKGVSIKIEKEWINVNDHLPSGFWAEDSEQEFYKKFSQLVNVVVDNGTVGTAAYNRETKKWFIGDLSKERYLEFTTTNVTHWQPLPIYPF